MRNSNIVMLALRTLFSKVIRKYRVPIANKFGCIEKSITQITRTRRQVTFL